MARVFKSQDYDKLLDYAVIVQHLESYQKAGDHRRWDDYAAKIPEATRQIWAIILKECARNGFIAPYVSESKLQWRRIMTHGAQADLCTLCERECLKREDIDNGETKWRRMNMPNYHEPKKCWDGSHD